MLNEHLRSIIGFTYRFSFCTFHSAFGILPPRCLCLIVLYFCTSGYDSVCADDWPQWHGLNRNAVSREIGLLTSWTDTTPAVDWRASDVGTGYSSVVVSHGIVFTTGKIDGDVYCFAIDLKTGERKWSSKIGNTSRNVMATPTVHEESVYALDPDGDLTCLKTSDGEIVWRHSLTEGFAGRLMSGRGYGESPLVDGDRLICTPGGAEAMIVALDRHTGKVIWKSAIPDIGEKGRDGAAFSSIGISHAAGVRQYVQLAGRGLIGIEAKSGRFLWGYNDISNGTANIPTPIVREDFIFSANGYHAGALLLKIERDEESETGVTAREVYRLRGNRFQNHHGGFVLIDDHVFGGHGSNNGLPTCIEFRTGKIAWKQRGPGTGSASVVAADGHLYFHYQNGVVALIEANPETYRLKGTFKLPKAGGDSWSHPVIAHGKLFLREQKNLSAYNLRSDASADSHPESRTIPTEFATLLELKASVEFTGGNVRVNHTSLYDFAAGNDGDVIPVITLFDRHITADGSLSDAAINELQQLKTAFVLNVSGTSISVSGIRQAAAIEQLVGLGLEFCPRVDDAAFEPLKQARRLRVLMATGTSIGRAGLAHIAELPDLVALDLEVCENITDTSCDVLARMNQLRALVLKKTGFEPDRISPKGLKQLAMLKNLEVLNLYGEAISDETLKQLQPFGNLRELDLSLTAISDAGLVHLTHLKKLTHLTLLYSEGFAGPKITNAGLKPLSKLTQLRNLNLVGAKVTDDAIDDLKQLKTLRRLTLTRSGISTDGLHSLQTALTDCL